VDRRLRSEQVGTSWRRGEASVAWAVAQVGGARGALAGVMGMSERWARCWADAVLVERARGGGGCGARWGVRREGERGPAGGRL
jgi:hypothetical protein